MQIKLKFLGAAQNVIGSRHFLHANGIGLLVDCGQEHISQERISEIRRVVHSGTAGIRDKGSYSQQGHPHTKKNLQPCSRTERLHIRWKQSFQENQTEKNES